MNEERKPVYIKDRVFLSEREDVFISTEIVEDGGIDVEFKLFDGTDSVHQYAFIYDQKDKDEYTAKVRTTIAVLQKHLQQVEEEVAKYVERAQK